MSDLEAMLKRVQELEGQGRSHHEAFGIASSEQKLANWPVAMGDKLHVLIYGDFAPPAADVRFERLGVTVHAEPQTGTVAYGVQCALLAFVDVPSKDAVGLRDAADRIEVLLGAWTLVDWGNCSCHWWSYLTHGTPGGKVGKWDLEPTQTAADSLLSLRPEIRRLVRAAMYWVREPRLPMMLGIRSDALAVYAGYWNAFECLVEAVNIAVPPPRLSRSEKQRRIDEYLSGLGRNPNPADIATMHREIVDVGFTGKATTALRTAFGADGDHYARECFHIDPKERRLYQIRNDINHGTVDAGDAERVLVVEDRLHRLEIMVLRLFRAFVSYPSPADSSIPATQDDGSGFAWSFTPS